MLSQKQIKILIIDDDEDDFYIISGFLKEINGVDFIIDWCKTYSAAVEEIKSGAHDIYFVDYRLGNKTGLDLLKECIHFQPDRPIILLTGKGNKSIDIEAMKSGATDYVIKSELNSEKLERCIRYSLDRTASLKAVKESENKYRNLFTGSKDSLFIADKNLVLKEINKAAFNLLGCNERDLSHISLYDFIPNVLLREKIKTDLNADKNIFEVEIEIENIHKEKRYCLLSILPESKTVGKVLFHGIIQDVTNIKRAEQINLQSARLAATERLIRILAHEIRNPLNNIQLSVDNLEMIMEANEITKELVGIIQRNTLRINNMITELLESTKTLELTFEEQVLQDLVEESLSVASDRIRLQNIKLHKVYLSSPLYILADKSKLQIAFSNILINAIESMESDKGVLSVIVNEAPDTYQVSIKDNGKGIPPEQLSKIFEPFFTMKKNGMGLGLSAAYGIFQSHKATLHVESVPNNGTTFTMNFNKSLKTPV
ncbi:MAG TPA: ATP-binding protein [Hanamia sp.]|nr:ATP-binding protein [Hanamia sp.]